VKKKIIILDVDGVMTTGKFLYSSKGKLYKEFGAHDSDGLNLLKQNGFQISFITSDKKGFKISKKRISDDLGFKLDLISEKFRLKYLEKKYGLKNIIYFGDGYHDAKILKKCFFGIAPKNARYEAKKAANFVTESKSAEGAVLDGALKILKKFTN